jgi:hypothetical protein
MTLIVTILVEISEATKTVDVRIVVPAGASVSTGTFTEDFERIRPYLSDKPLRHPCRAEPASDVTNAQLKRIAGQNPPPQEWLDGEEECPF